ncbi:hypothetical protein F1D05_09650 [Kribbella qitaiheensis]|uniref:Uncharacterized protein n=1 Tax=Kribbella qitaiheensis TaxID=1544730 RepID=A0A7G6WVT9_9ACTN|nr:hypothetical protein [Kribbella qitaiheensis]QNE18104.1 hypothetical protein F1D05_09650 [Kribbella qitaiheensis]
MTAIDTHSGPDELIERPPATYDLIICCDDQILFRDHYETREKRLSQCVGILTGSDLLTTTITAERASLIHERRDVHATQGSDNPDLVVKEIAELCHRWGVQIYAGTTSKRNRDTAGSEPGAVPGVLYSVITEYGPGQIAAEHFPDRESRIAGLVDRAEQFFATPGQIPDFVLSDEKRLAALVATFLMPAAISLTESVLDESDGVYRPTGIASPLGEISSPNNRAG